MSNVATVTPEAPARAGLIRKLGDRYGVEPAKLMDTLKATAFKVKDAVVSDAQMMALAIVADQYKLNPFTKEIYAFPDDRGGIVPVVGVDGWSRIINEHPQFDGMEFEWDPVEKASTCIIYRKDRAHPTRVTEYMDECKRGTKPWNTHPRRMLRHKSMIQCARMAFGFAGIYDPDEAERIIDNGSAPLVASREGVDAVRSELKRLKRGDAKPHSTAPQGRAAAAADVIDMEPSGQQRGQDDDSQDKPANDGQDNAGEPPTFAELEAELIAHAKDATAADAVIAECGHLTVKDQAALRRIRARQIIDSKGGNS